MHPRAPRLGAPLVERDSSGDPRVNTNGDQRATFAVFLMLFVCLFDLICPRSRKNDNLWKSLGDIVVNGALREYGKYLNLPLFCLNLPLNRELCAATVLAY